MAADGQVRERVYREIKRKLIEGELALDQHLDLRLLCDVFEASPTPVKEALVRLTGERLVTAKEKGFQVARWTTTQLGALYEWRLKLVLMSLDSTSIRPVPAPTDSRGNYASRVRQLLEALEAEAGDEHHHAARNADDRLSYARFVEPELWYDTDDELVKIEAAMQISEVAVRVEVLRGYFTRRIEAAQAIRDRAIVRSHPNGD